MISAKTKRILSVLTTLVVSILVYTGCSINYTLSGASIPEEATTFSVEFFPNQATFVNPNLSQTFTEYLKEFTARQTRLEQVDRGGDMQFGGEITRYNIRPMAITQDATAAETRLTIAINVRFTNGVYPDKDFENEFSGYADFPSDVSIQSVEDELINDIIRQISEDIFNKAFTDW